MEYISGGPIIHLTENPPYPNPLPFDKVRSYFRDIIYGVEYCEFSLLFSKTLK